MRTSPDVECVDWSRLRDAENFARYALSACEPKVPTLLEAAEAAQRALTECHSQDVWDKNCPWCRIDVPGHRPACLYGSLVAAIARERAAQEANAPPTDEQWKAAMSPAPEAAGDFGEPWEFRHGDQPQIVTRNNCAALQLRDRRKRATACTNALAGCNPDRLGELVEVAQGILGHYWSRVTVCGHCARTHSQSHVDGCPIGRLDKALAAFKPEPKK